MAKKKSTDPMDEQMFDSAVEEAAEGFPPADSPPFYISDSSETEMPPPDRDAYNTDSNGWEEYGEEPPVPAEGESDNYNTVLQEMGDSIPVESTDAPESASPNPGYSADDLLLLSEEPGAESVSPAEESPPLTTPPRSSPRRERVLTIDARSEIETQEDRDAAIWHEIQNSYRTRRILTGTLDGVERTDSGMTLAVVSYKGFRVAIPIKEMMLHTGRVPTGREYVEWLDRLQRILNSRLGSEIDFVVKGLDNSTRSVAASRRDAMLRKRRSFYMDTDDLGEHMIYEGRIVQARVVAVAEKVIRVEVFGVECSIMARGLSWEWIGNARDHFNVGDRILVRVLKIERSDVEHISIQADVRSVSATNNRDNLKKCLPQCRYAGRVTDVRNGVVFIRLNNGVNAIAHSCYDLRAPGKKDDVSFAVTRLDEEQGVAVGIITRIIKQNL